MNIPHALAKLLGAAWQAIWDPTYPWPEGRSPRVGTRLGAIRENGTSYPKNLLRRFLKNNLARQKITSKNKNNLARFICMLVLKGIFGGSLKITLENKNNFQGRK